MPDILAAPRPLLAAPRPTTTNLWPCSIWRTCMLASLILIGFMCLYRGRHSSIMPKVTRRQDDTGKAGGSAGNRDSTITQHDHGYHTQCQPAATFHHIDFKARHVDTPCLRTPYIHDPQPDASKPQPTVRHPLDTYTDAPHPLRVSIL